MTRAGSETLAALLRAAPAPPPPFDAAFAEDSLTALRPRITDPRIAAALRSLFGHAPFLARCARHEAEDLPVLLAQPLAVSMAQCLEQVRAAANRDTLMSILRRQRRRVALLAAIADVNGLWTLEETTGALSDFADACICAALDWLFADAVRQGRLPADASARKGGLAVIAMGKLGARELNYSSDVDLVAFYAPAASARAAALFPGMMRALVRILQEPTADGHVCRVDLRLRPDPGVTPVVVSMEAAARYYENLGQNWERAAFIKARPVAGDLEAGRRFLADLAPFIWRRHLDFAAIGDIHAMKRQIHAVRGHGTVAVAGHNVKLGRGGIREIELFVQTQQLIAGGRDRTLRAPATCAALALLARAGWITPAAACELTRAYGFLRRVEHRLQMINDEQTHTLPRDDPGLARVAGFMGFDRASFAAALSQHLRCVQGHYAALFEAAPSLGAGGSLVFTGTEDDPETLETLGRMGFASPPAAAALVRGWHHGRMAATRDARAGQMLTELTPPLLGALAAAASPDAALAQFDRFLQGLPAGVQVFALLRANPDLLRLLTRIVGSAPRLSARLARTPAILDAMLAPDFHDPLPRPFGLLRSLRTAVAPAPDLQDTLAFAGAWAQETHFRIGARFLAGDADAVETGDAYARAAAALVVLLLPLARKQTRARHGPAPGSIAVIAMGKFGSREMSAVSDLDLIMVHDVPAAQASGWFARAGQRFITTLTAPLPGGRLYQVDLRLRPSGHAGALMTHMDAFARYQREDAWTWEHMALTRARTVAGPMPLRRRLEAIIAGVLTLRRKRADLAADVAAMRARIRNARPATGPWDLKHAPGGLIDLEFICQFLLLATAHDNPEVLHPHTPTALERLARAGVLSAAAAGTLLDAYDLCHTLTHALRLAVDGPFDPDTASPALRLRLAKAAGAPDFQTLGRRLEHAQRQTRALFSELLDLPRRN